jgi:hypothetical protein
MVSNQESRIAQEGAKHVPPAIVVLLAVDLEISLIVRKSFWRLLPSVFDAVADVRDGCWASFVRVTDHH